jgi:hypothetical protein
LPLATSEQGQSVSKASVPRKNCRRFSITTPGFVINYARYTTSRLKQSGLVNPNLTREEAVTDAEGASLEAGARGEGRGLQAKVSNGALAKSGNGVRVAKPVKALDPTLRAS